MKIFSGGVNFYKLLIKQSKYTLDGALALSRYFEKQDDSETDKVKCIEKKADEERKNIIQELDKTYITPFEREDIFTLSRAIDDILDYFNTTVKEMRVYEKIDETVNNLLNNITLEDLLNKYDENYVLDYII